MIKTVTVTNYLGESLTLELSNPFDIGINVRSIEGIGPPKGNVNYTEIASGDGGQFNSARASIRNITMQLGLMPVPTVEESRHRVYKYFPLDQQVTLRFETDKRLCEITGWVEECEPDIFSDDEVIDISIVCPDPYFYSVDSQLGTVNFSGVVDEFEFPFENSPDNESQIYEMMLEDNGFPDLPGEYPLYPVEVDPADTTNQYIEFASLVYRQEENVPYDGDVPTGVVMRLHAIGEVRNITIYNMDTRERIVISTDRIEAITGHDFNTGDDIIITTTRGSKSIEYVHEGISYNILNALEKDTDWFMISKGDNVFAYICEYGTEDLQFRLEYPTLYWGI